MTQTGEFCSKLGDVGGFAGFVLRKTEEQCEIEQAPTSHEAFARRPECSSGDAAASSTLRSHA